MRMGKGELSGWIPAWFCGVLLWSVAAHALAATSAGSRDPTFGANGVAIVNPTTGIDQMSFGALQPDGKLVGAGNISLSGSAYAFGVVRYLDNGAPDPGFAVNGIGIYGIDTNSYAHSLLVAADGKLYVIGTAETGGTARCAVLRLLPNGQIDGTYGTAGVSRFAPPTGQPFCTRGALLPDGRILVAGYTGSTAFVARLNVDGSVDTTFGDGQGLAFVQGVAMDIYNIALGPGGRIAVFGSRVPAGNPGAVAVMQPNGSMDTSFHGNGVYSDGALFGAQVLDGKFHSDGRLVVTGNSPDSKPAVWRLNANGTPDVAFGTGGMSEWLIAPLTGGWGRSIVIQPDGKYVIGIRSLVTGNQVRFSALRLHDTGALDLAFGTGGQVVVETGNTQGDYVYGTELAPDGKIWLTGTGTAPGGDQAYMAARLIGAETTTVVVEFYNSTLVHYFITADPNEAAAIDGGAAGPGWERTGKTFKSGGPSRVCRFYGSPDIDPATGMRRGPNSHFYTIDPAECAAVKTDIGWRFESYDFSGRPRSGAACPAGTVAVLRAYNNRFAQNDSNHRYMTEQATYDAMLAQGWSGEGAVFCAPL